MARITVPEFYCPIRSALNKHVAAAEEFAMEWAREFGFIATDDTWGVGPAHIGYLAGYANPYASWEGLKIAVAWLDWLMVYDDGMFDKRVNVDKLDQATIVRFHHQVLEIMRGVSDGDADQPLHQGMRDIRQAIRRLRPEWDMSSFIRGFARYFQSNLWEATNIWRRRPAHLSIYTNMRRHTGCLFPTYELSGALLGINLRPEARAHVALRQLEIMANNYTCWLNDVFSFEREHVDGQVNNLVEALRCEFDTTYAEAAERAVTMCRVEMDSYLELKDRLPSLGLHVDEDLARYLEILESWMRALFDWHHMTGRYVVRSEQPA